MSCVYILGREYYKHFIYNNKTLIYEFCYFVFGAHAVVCVTCACAVFSTSRQFYSTESEKLPTKKNKTPPTPTSINVWTILCIKRCSLWVDVAYLFIFGNFVVSFCRIFQNYLFGLLNFILIKYTCHLFFKSVHNLFYSFTECLFDFYGNYIELLFGVYVVFTLRSIY